MPSHFPSMAPHLEHPAIGPDVHHSLAFVLRDELNARLPATHDARVETRTELGIVADSDEYGHLGVAETRSIVPYALILRRPRPEPDGGVALAELRRPAVSRRVAFEPLGDEPVRHFFVEIRDPTRNHKLITLIEILSPTNKRPGTDRLVYSEKQRQVLESDASLVEIDLHRVGRHVLPSPELETAVSQLDPPATYVVFVSPAWMRRPPTWGYVAYPVTIRESLPCVGIPLRAEEPELPLDLQWSFSRVYDGGPYRRGAVDYSGRPAPPLDPTDASWAETRLLEAGFRCPS